MPKVKKKLSSYENCQACPLHKTRRRIVIGRGVLPCDLLIIGEGPGMAEDSIGKPFVGPSGDILYKIRRVAEHIAKTDHYEYKEYITNVVACRPTDKKGGKNRSPYLSEIAACSDRLKNIVQRAKPKLIVLLGNTAQTSFVDFSYKTIGLYHPAYILRTGGESSALWRSYVSEWVKVYVTLRRLKNDNESLLVNE